MSSTLLDRPALADDAAQWEIISPHWVIRSVDEEDRQGRALLSHVWSGWWDSPEDQSYRIR